MAAPEETQPSFHCAPALTEEERAQAMHVRFTVFVEEQQVPPELEIDEADREALHYILYREARVVGTARLVRKPPHGGKAGRVAVLREARGGGAGKVLMEYVIDEARRQGMRELCLDAQLPVIAFYEKLGFVAEGSIFYDAGILHRTMRRSL